MALPSLTEQLSDIASTTIYNQIPVVQDNFFKSNPLWIRLMNKNKVLLDGGRDIRETMIYDELVGGSYGQGDTFDTSDRNTLQQSRFEWKRTYVNVVIDGLDEMKNHGTSAIINYASTKVEIAEMTLKNKMGGQLFGDGTGNSGNDIVGLSAICDDGTNVSTYGGITRDTSTQGTAVKAYYNGTGGALSLDMLRTAMGSCTIANEWPDLIVTTQAIWDKIWARINPSERYASEDLKKVGMKGIQFDGADVVVDQQCPSGRVFLLNTNHIKLYIHSAKNFQWSGWIRPSNKDEQIGQIMLGCVLSCRAPRLQGQIRNVT